MKKHQEIDWNQNNRINLVTNNCLNYMHGTYTFEEYLDERAKKNTKFVSLDDSSSLNKVFDPA